MNAKKISIVLGLGYGDEGKGLCTDFLSNSSNRPLVIRFNGGHQAGHTVVTKAGVRHMFSHFGSGTLRGIPTFWSRYCTFSPSYLLYELDHLPVEPKLYVDKYCPVTTHYDVLFNRALEASRGSGRFGSCGVGFGATIDRHKLSGLRFFAGELTNQKKVRKLLSTIRQYYRQKIESQTKFSFRQFDHDSEDKVFESYIDRINLLLPKGIIEFTEERKIFSNLEWQSYVFEGAQGILLDQKYGNKPFITKSNTTSQNAFELLIKNGVAENSQIEIFYVTRSYLTRHGGGPFIEFDPNYKLSNIENETNVLNEFQGEFKKGYLNTDLMNYALMCDRQYSVGIKKNLVMTCIDQLPNDCLFYRSKDKIHSASPKRFIELLETKFGKIFFSSTPCSEELK